MYDVPNHRIVLGFPNVQRYSVHVKSFPFFGCFKAMEWRKNDIGLHLKKLMSQDILINATMTATGKDFRVMAHPNNECWTIQTGYNVIYFCNGAKLAPSKHVQECC
jgi:hypothetical protein